MKRSLWMITLIVLLAFPTLTFAQTTPAYINWIPADFDGFVRVSMDDPALALRRLNFGLFVAASLEWARFPNLSETPTLDQYFPLDMLDLETASFGTNVAPWLGDEVVIAYRDLNADFQADQTLMILPTYDSFTSAFRLRSAIQAQDFLQRDPYRDTIIYVGDRTAIAFTPQAILIASEDILEATIDMMLDGGTALTADPQYQQITAQLSAEAPITAYITGDAVGNALPMLLGGDNDALLGVLGGALGPEGGTFGALLTGAPTAMGLSFNPNMVSLQEVEARVVLATESGTVAALDPAVLDFIPRSAMIVYSGADGATLGEHALTALPLGSFIPAALASFGVQPIPGEVLPLPTSEQITMVIERFTAALGDTTNVDLRADVLAHLNGSFALAVIPRPNNPLPVWNLPVEVLLVAQVDNADATVDSLLALIESFTADRFTRDRVDGNPMFTLTVPDSETALLQIGSVDNWLLIGLGASVDAALAAQRGDNRLTAQSRWSALAEEMPPNVYVDLNSYFNTFFPPEGGTTQSSFSQMGLYWQALDGGLFQIDAVVTLP